MMAATGMYILEMDVECRRCYGLSFLFASASLETIGRSCKDDIALTFARQINLSRADMLDT